MEHFCKITQKTFRLIPTKYPPIQTFDEVSSAEELNAVMELEGWTNDRLVAHRLNRLPKSQWVYGSSNASIVMAAFLHTPNHGLRFNSGQLGAWYCSLDIKTAIAEVSSHLRQEAFDTGSKEMRSTYRCYSAKLQGEYLDIRNQQSSLPKVYDPNNWQDSQHFGETQRSNGATGIAYSSVRHIGGENVVAFNPKKITKVTVAESFDLIVPIEGKIIARKLP